MSGAQSPKFSTLQSTAFLLLQKQKKINVIMHDTYAMCPLLLLLFPGNT